MFKIWIKKKTKCVSLKKKLSVSAKKKLSRSKKLRNITHLIFIYFEK